MSEEEWAILINIWFAVMVVAFLVLMGLLIVFASW